MYWFTSDTHFNHKNIIKFCDRPFKTLKQMNESLIRNWNERVKPKDTIFHLGDFCFKGNPNKILSLLNGNIILVRGNHDKKAIIDGIVLTLGQKSWYLTHKPQAIGKYHICGHVHKSWKVLIEDKSIFVNVGVDVWNYRPVNINEIFKAIRGKITK